VLGSVGDDGLADAEVGSSAGLSFDDEHAAAVRTVAMARAAITRGREVVMRRD
jgi:hypothetical protein